MFTGIRCVGVSSLETTIEKKTQAYFSSKDTVYLPFLFLGPGIKNKKKVKDRKCEQLFKDHWTTAVPLGGSGPAASPRQPVQGWPQPPSTSSGLPMTAELSLSGPSLHRHRRSVASAMDMFMNVPLSLSLKGSSSKYTVFSPGIFAPMSPSPGGLPPTSYLTA